ncbi:hypothetical protein Tco_1304432 [Tanacetum coccineum]
MRYMLWLPSPIQLYLCALLYISIDETKDEDIEGTGGIIGVEEESCPVYDIDNEEEESMPVYDTNIENVIEDEEGFVKKGGFGGE